MSKKQKLNLIDELTTHKCDYKYWPLYPVQAKTLYRPREEAERKPPSRCVYIDTQSHAPYKPEASVPFDLYIEPKPIVGTDPRDTFEINKSAKQKPRPKYVHLSTLLPPALSVDEIEDEKDLQTIRDYTYIGMHKMLMEEAALKPSHSPNPPKRVETEDKNLNFKANLYSPLPPGWITAAKHWDCLQNRALGDPFKTFWSRKGPEVECSCCCNPLPHMLSQETKQEITQLVDQNRLRLPYDITITGYGGFRPQVGKGVPLAKSEESAYITNALLR